jgi:hypothetical protein
VTEYPDRVVFRCLNKDDKRVRAWIDAKLKRYCLDDPRTILLTGFSPYGLIVEMFPLNGKKQIVRDHDGWLELEYE